jgi:hypothetical protein
VTGGGARAIGASVLARYNYDGRLKNGANDE